MRTILEPKEVTIGTPKQASWAQTIRDKWLEGIDQRGDEAETEEEFNCLLWLWNIIGQIETADYIIDRRDFSFEELVGEYKFSVVNGRLVDEWVAPVKKGLSRLQELKRRLRS